MYEMARGGAHGRFQLGTPHKLPTSICCFATGVCGGKQLVAATHYGMHSGGCDACSFSAEQKGGTIAIAIALESARVKPEWVRDRTEPEL